MVSSIPKPGETAPRAQRIAAKALPEVGASKCGIWSEWAPLVAEYKAACAKIISAEKASTRHRYGNCRGETANRRLGKNAARVLEERPLRGPSRQHSASCITTSAWTQTDPAQRRSATRNRSPPREHVQQRAFTVRAPRAKAATSLPVQSSTNYDAYSGSPDHW